MSRITIGLDESDTEKTYLLISDNGVGMSSDVITNYLLGIASDYWHSSTFYSNYPGVISAGFKPAGRFGIGFLSVFMVGQNIEVQSQRRAGPHSKLRISGLGKRGALVTTPSRVSFGTTVRIEITNQDKTIYQNLDAIVRARAPMLDIPIVVNQSTGSVTIQPGWWKTVPQEEFHEFVMQWEKIGQGLTETAPNTSPHYYYISDPKPLSKIKEAEKWRNRQPEIITETSRIMAIPNQSDVLVCTRGIAVSSIPMKGLTGIVEAEDLDLVAARSEALHFNVAELRATLLDKLKPQIIESLNALSNDFIPDRFEFLATVGSVYGDDVLRNTTLRWITVVDKQGNSILMSPSDLIDKLSGVTEVLVSYGTTPWKATPTAKMHFPAATRNALVLPVPKAGQSYPGSYNDRDEITVGELSEHFERYSGAVPVILRVILQLLSDAWAIQSSVLEAARWSRHKTDNLNAHFVKSKLK